MKKKISICLCIVILVIIGIFAYKNITKDSYYYDKLNSIKLPEETQVLKKQVEKSDVYGWHVCVEEIIGTTLNYDEFTQYIVHNNNNDDRIDVHPVEKDDNGYYVDWDDYCIDPNCIKGKEQEGMEYYLVSYNTPYGYFDYEKSKLITE